MDSVVFGFGFDSPPSSPLPPSEDVSYEPSRVPSVAPEQPSIESKSGFPPVHASSLPLNTVQEGLDGNYYEVDGDSVYKYWTSLSDSRVSQFDSSIDSFLDEQNEDNLRWEEECKACYLGVCEEHGADDDGYNYSDTEEDYYHSDSSDYYDSSEYDPTENYDNL